MTFLTSSGRTGRSISSGGREATVPFNSRNAADRIMRMLAEPRTQTAEVAHALEVLLAAASNPSTGDRSRTASPTAMSGRFESVVELISGAITDLEAGAEESDHLFQDSAPEFVPAGWADFLSAKAIEDPELRLPWHDELG